MITEQNLKTAIDNWKTGHYGEDYYGRNTESVICPVCGEDTYELYKNTHTNEIVGCNYCIELKYSYEII